MLRDGTPNWGTLKPVPPMSNLERQRRFRKRHPGYYKRLHRKRKAAEQALGEQLKLEKAIRQFMAQQLPPPERCLPAPEQVTPSWADQLMRDVQKAAAERAEAAERVPARADRSA
jgi:hypothetical protein